MNSLDLLIGKWSAYLYNGYGTMEDVILVFKSDGTGWYAFEHLVLCELETFKWSFNSDKTLKITGEQYSCIGADGKGYESKPSTSITTLSFIITIKESMWPDDKRQFLVLSILDADFAGSNKFALATKEVKDLDIPVFPS